MDTPNNHTKMLPAAYERHWLKEERPGMFKDADFVLTLGYGYNETERIISIFTFKPLKPGFDEALAELIHKFVQ